MRGRKPKVRTLSGHLFSQVVKTEKYKTTKENQNLPFIPIR